MAFASFEQGDDSEANAEINMVPFIDVMLVLLIIFMITAPLMSHAVKVELPKASSQPLQTQVKPVEIAITAAGEVFIGAEPVRIEALAARLAAYAPDTELHLRADRQTTYDIVAKVMTACARAGLSRIGFVTEPEAA